MHLGPARRYDQAAHIVVATRRPRGYEPPGISFKASQVPAKYPTMTYERCRSTSDREH